MFGKGDLILFLYIKSYEFILNLTACFFFPTNVVKETFIPMFRL